MTYASDKLYKEYLIKNMPTIVTRVKAREIVPYLPCLTDHDRETIEAKREMYGNYNSMVLLLDCLKRRENWPEQFIQALEACGHPTMAAEVRREYDALKGINNSSPNSPPTTVIRAHVHPAPSASHLPIPESGGPSQAAAAASPAPPAAAAAPVAPPAEAAAPPAETAAPPAEAAAPPAETAAPPAEAAAPPVSAAPVAPPAKAAAPPAEVAAPPAEAAAPPAEAAAPPAAQASPPLDVRVQPKAPESPAAQVPEAVPPPEPVAEPPQSTQIEVAPAPSTPPPSPEAPHTEATTATPPPQREINSHQEPEENSESDIQGITGDNGVTAGNVEVLISSVDAPSCPDPLPTTTTTTATEVRPPRSPSPTQTDSDVTDGSDFLPTTPEKPPVQDTTPPVNVKPAVVLQPEETSEPPATQVVESSPQTETAPATSPLPGAAGIDTPLSDDDDVCLSKPGHLVSICPQNNGSPAIPAPSPPSQPYSGDSDRLEISEAAPDAVSSAHASTCSAVSSTAEITVTALPCQENGIALDHNEPEENFYESTCQSLGPQDVRENVVQISEEPSILNLDGQSSTPQAQIFNGKAAKEITSAPPISANAADTVSSVNTPSSENHHPSEPAPAEGSLELKTLQDSEEIPPSRTLPANTKYILTAAGVGACALLMAWKFKN